VAVRNRWLSPGAIKLHVAVFVAVGGCTAAFWWQLFRALHGHTRSWAYAVEWPVFAAYAVWMWWKLLREEPGFARADAEAAPDSMPDWSIPSRSSTEPKTEVLVSVVLPSCSSKTAVSTEM